MSDVIKDDDTDVIAAEFVLGTLDADERTRAKVLLDLDHGFRGMVRMWERRFGELHLMVEPVEPAPQVWERIKLKIADIEPSSEITLPEPPPEPEPAPPEQTGLPEPAAPEPAATEPQAIEPQAIEPAVPEGAAPEPAVPEAAEAEPELAEPRSPERVRKESGLPPIPAEVVPTLVAAERHDPADGARRGLRRWRLVAGVMTLLVSPAARSGPAAGAAGVPVLRIGAKNARPEAR